MHTSPMDHLRLGSYQLPPLHLPIFFVEISRLVRDVPMNLTVDLVCPKLGYMTWWYDMLSQVVQRWFFQLFFFGFLRRSGILLRRSFFSKEKGCNRHRWYSSGSKWSTHSFGMPRHLESVVPSVENFHVPPKKKSWIESFNDTCWVFQNVADKFGSKPGCFFWWSHKRSGLPCWWTESSDLKCSRYRHRDPEKRTTWFARCISIFFWFNHDISPGLETTMNLRTFFWLRMQT